jgi:hypothetical protein
VSVSVKVLGMDYRSCCTRTAGTLKMSKHGSKKEICPCLPVFTEESLHWQSQSVLHSFGQQSGVKARMLSVVQLTRSRTKLQVELARSTEQPAKYLQVINCACTYIRNGNRTVQTAAVAMRILFMRIASPFVAANVISNI